MIRRVQQTLLFWCILGDLAAVALAWIGAYYLRFSSGWIPAHKAIPDERICWNHLPLILFLAVVSFRMTGQYQLDRLRRFREELVAVLKGSSLLTLAALALIFYEQDDYRSRAVMALFAVLTVLLVLAARRLFWTVLRAVRARGYNQTRALVVGSGRVARRTIRTLQECRWSGIRPIGYIDEKKSPHPEGVEYLGSLDDLPHLVELYQVEHVFLALPMQRYDLARQVFNALSQQVVDVRLVVDVPNFAGMALTTTTLDALPIVGLRESPHYGLNIVVKRSMDLLLAAVGLALISPLMLLLALLVKLTSPGPVFYRQERCSLNGRPFWMLKFRSMRTDSEAQGAQMTRRGDPRCTRLGAILRKTSLDELPQLINVLRGEMSLVGPRPERPVFIQQFRHSIPNYMTRHSVKCGITGWAQVNGWRGNTSLRKRIQYDLYYITHWNPFFDLRILVLTVWRGFFHKNAY